MAGSVEFVGVIDDEDNTALSINNDGSINVDVDSVSGSARSSQDTDSFNASLAGGSSTTLTVNTSLSDTVVMTIDDGTTGNEPVKYDLTQNIFKDAVSDFMFYDKVEGSRSRSWVDPAPGSQFQVVVTNTTNSSATFRIVLESFQELQ